MSVDVAAEVRIRRPLPEVASYMFEPRNDAVWTTGVVESRPLGEGPLVRGARVERVSKFLGRTFGYVYEVTDRVGDERVEMRVEEPFPMRITYTLRADGDATVASIRTAGDATGFFRLAAPFMGRMVRRSITNDLELLREVLEADGGATNGA